MAIFSSLIYPLIAWWIFPLFLYVYQRVYYIIPWYSRDTPMIFPWYYHTWWLIPLSKWVITPIISGLTLLIPFITGVITHLLSGMSHQVLNHIKTTTFVGSNRALFFRPRPAQKKPKDPSRPSRQSRRSASKQKHNQYVSLTGWFNGLV